MPYWRIKRCIVMVKSLLLREFILHMCKNSVVTNKNGVKRIVLADAAHSPSIAQLQMDGSWRMSLWLTETPRKQPQNTLYLYHYYQTCCYSIVICGSLQVHCIHSWFCGYCYLTEGLWVGLEVVYICSKGREKHKHIYCISWGCVWIKPEVNQTNLMMKCGLNNT